MSKFIGKPYLWIPFRSIPNYPIRNYTMSVDGITFDSKGEFITEDSLLIDGLREIIARHEGARALEVNKNLHIPCPIQEYSEDMKPIAYIETTPEPANEDNSVDDEAIQRIKYLLRL